MSISTDLTEEISILARYNLSTTQEGIKVHHTAAAETIAAIKRLYEKNLVTQEDGGYLTDLGIETAEHIQKALTILTSK
ncbi:MAG: TIGR02647 family protein [Gammaproteobacteria bacterium]|nr:MAG: TIGR02647 family protein [Gammaproteobacteria bacterium]